MATYAQVQTATQAQQQQTDAMLQQILNSCLLDLRAHRYRANSDLQIPQE